MSDPMKVHPVTGVILQDEHGYEVPDPQPMQVRTGFKRPETLAEQVQRLVRGAISRQAEEAGMETFEDSEDFDVESDSEPNTPYEEFFDPVLGKSLTPREFQAHEAIYRDRYLRAQQEYFSALDRAEVLRKGGRAGNRPSSESGAGAVSEEAAPSVPPTNTKK